MNGVNVFTENLLRGLRGHGWDARILLTNPLATDPLVMERPPDLPIDSLSVGPAAAVRTRWRALRSYLCTNAPCLYLPNYDVYTSCISPTLPDRVAIVGVVHADDPRHYEHAARLGSTWNAIVAVSDTIAQRCRERLPDLADRLRTIPIGVSVPSSGVPRRLLDSTRPIHVAYCGLLKQHQKRVFDIPLVLNELERRGVPVVVTFAGDGPERAELESRCAGLTARGSARFLGIVRRDELGSLLEQQDAILLTSEFEGLPNALLEAMARGCVPVVTEIESGVPEVVTNLDNGLTAPVGDTVALADRLERLYREPALLARLSAAAFRSVADGPYSLSRMVGSYEALFREVLCEAANGGFRRPRGLIVPPAELLPLWRHYIPEPIKRTWRVLRPGQSRD